MMLTDATPEQVLPLFRALHNFHVACAPDVYHADGSDKNYLDLLRDHCARGARLLGHDAGWGLVSYVLATPVAVPRDEWRCGYRAVRVDHLYVSPTHRGHGLARDLLKQVRDWARETGLESWIVTWHATNPGAGETYSRLDAQPVLVTNRGWLR